MWQHSRYGFLVPYYYYLVVLTLQQIIEHHYYIYIALFLPYQTCDVTDLWLTNFLSLFLNGQVHLRRANPQPWHSCYCYTTVWFPCFTEDGSKSSKRRILYFLRFTTIHHNLQHFCDKHHSSLFPLFWHISQQ